MTVIHMGTVDRSQKVQLLDYTGWRQVELGSHQRFEFLVIRNSRTKCIDKYRNWLRNSDSIGELDFTTGAHFPCY